MFKKLKNFICKLFNIKACQCDEVDEHIEYFTKVPAKAKGLKKLPKQVRNKMGFHKSGGRVGMGVALRGGGRVR